MLEVEVGQQLTTHGGTLAVAESCTGGLLAQRITAVPGSSAYFLGGVIAYHNEIKVQLLGVPRDVIVRHGGVSAECTRAMAEGVRARLGSDFALAISGIAGPSGGTPGKPVGLVYVALASSHGTWVEEHRFRGSRHGNRWSASEAALSLLLRHLGSS
ncbi:MAG: ADP-ribose pyrophosphatase of COG1058 family [Candidatus Bipolaricaulis sibiricus]|uniref:ADP-ribose pyrophosphatase of COG1058 family n=1 Tax=Bipolaricaulis sibiricus TaxID=2501609 RepID=A0A410FVB9_BIPS1|nr:MAG: ADP-ribose pyrophosphatase of COG1058 family [Candidatus Bipolaricaulis sibiricus]